MNDYTIQPNTVAGRLARRLAAFDKYQWQLYPTTAQGRKQSRYELRAVELIGLLKEAGALAPGEVHVVMGNDYPVAVGATEAAAERLIREKREEQREKLRQVYSNPADIEVRLGTYYLRPYPFEVQT